MCQTITSTKSDRYTDGKMTRCDKSRQRCALNPYFPFFWREPHEFFHKTSAEVTNKTAEFLVTNQWHIFQIFNLIGLAPVSTSVCLKFGNICTSNSCSQFPPSPLTVRCSPLLMDVEKLIPSAKCHCEGKHNLLSNTKVNCQDVYRIYFSFKE